MTTIGSQKKTYSFRPYLLIILGLFAIGAFVSIPLYSEIVNLKHTIKKAEQTAADLLVKNTEQRNELYELLDSERLADMAKELGLVLEKNPKYLELTSDSLATTL